MWTTNGSGGIFDWISFVFGLGKVCQLLGVAEVNIGDSPRAQLAGGPRHVLGIVGVWLGVAQLICGNPSYTVI